MAARLGFRSQHDSAGLPAFGDVPTGMIFLVTVGAQQPTFRVRRIFQPPLRLPSSGKPPRICQAALSRADTKRAIGY